MYGPRTAQSYRVVTLGYIKFSVRGEKSATHKEPPAAGPTALNRDIADIDMPFAAPLCSWD